LEITGGVLLRDKECVEVPETAFNIVISWHLLEAHFEEDLSELMPDFVEGV
jgi:hypothetical protein